MIKTFIAGLAIASTMFLVGCDSKESAGDSKPDGTEALANLNTKTLEVKKMDCGGCAAKVKKVLTKVEGMTLVKANPKTQTIEIAITDEAKFDIDKVIAVIKEDTGWDATVK